MNEHEALPSVSALGYSMQDLVYLIENRKVFYCKALGKKPVYLSKTAYQLLKRAKPAAHLSEAAKSILREMEKYEAVDKADLKLLFPWMPGPFKRNLIFFWNICISRPAPEKAEFQLVFLSLLYGPAV